jgi:phosphatidyl-myo-inositol dimannoside synthase
MPAYIDAGDVFAMPSRDRRFGLEVEALGIVSLEAAACGLAALAGNSGGAPDTVVNGETGFVVDPRDPSDIAARVVSLLADPDRAIAMGKAGRERVSREWSWDAGSVVLWKLLDR